MINTSPHRNSYHHLARSAAFLAVWVTLGGLVIAGWLTQLRPSASSIEGLDVVFQNSLDNDQATQPNDPSVPSSTSETTGAGSLAGQTDTGATTIGASGASSGINNGASAVTDPKTGDVTVPTVSDSDRQKLATAGIPITPGQQNTGSVTLTPAQATALGIVGGAASATANSIKLNCDSNDPSAAIAHPFGCELGAYIANLYQWAIVIGAGLAVLMIMWAGYTYVISAGDPEAVRTAKDYLWGALLGLAILILTYVIYNTLKVGVPNTTSSNPADNSPVDFSKGSGGSWDTNSPAQTPSGSSNPAATADIFGSYTAKITSISWAGRCGDEPNKPEYQVGASSPITVTDASSDNVTIKALENTTTGTRNGNTVTIPNKGITATFTPTQGSVHIDIKYTKTLIFNISCTVNAQIDGSKNV